MSLLKIFSKIKIQPNKYENTIKEFFFYHHGDSMSMDRDDPQKYNRYRSLDEETIEHFSGRTSHQKDGGIYIIQSAFRKFRDSNLLALLSIL